MNAPLWQNFMSEAESLSSEPLDFGWKQIFQHLCPWTCSASWFPQTSSIHCNIKPPITAMFPLDCIWGWGGTSELINSFQKTNHPINIPVIQIPSEANSPPFRSPRVFPSGFMVAACGKKQGTQSSKGLAYSRIPSRTYLCTITHLIDNMFAKSTSYIPDSPPNQNTVRADHFISAPWTCLSLFVHDHLLPQCLVFIRAVYRMDNFS